MSLTFDPPPLSRLRRYALIAAVFVTVWTTRVWTVGRFGSDLPYWDQWAKEGELFYEPWFEHHEFWHNLFVPHNEHRIAPTLALNFGLMRLGGDQWDARVQCIANAALFAGIAAGLAAWALRRQSRGWALACCGLIAVVAAPPIAWENVLGGFQSCFYFVTLASILALAGLLLAPPFSLRWFAGHLATALAMVSLGSGFLVALPVAAVALIRWWRERSSDRSRLEAFSTLGAAALIAAVGWWLRPQAPWHAGLHAHSISAAVVYLLRALAWPLYQSPWLAPLVWAPWCAFAWQSVRLKWIGRNQPENLIFALGLWVLAQAAAVSYARSGGSELPAPRYGDLFVVGVVVNAFALAVLARHSRAQPHGPSVTRAYAGAWFALVAVAIAFGTVLAVRGDLSQRKAETELYEQNVHAFVLSDDYARFDRQQPHLPFPITDWLARMIRNPALRRILPSSVHAPIAIAGFGSTPDRPANVPELGDRATRLVRSGETWESAPISAGSGYWKVEMAGDAGASGAALEVVSADNQRVLAEIAPTKRPGDSWRAAYVRAPHEPSRLRARVNSPAQSIAFSEPTAMSSLSYWTWRFTQQAQWFALLAWVALVALLCGGYAKDDLGPSRVPQTRQPAVAAPASGESTGHSNYDRVFGLDALRTTAILCVVLAHGGLQGVLGEFLQKLPVVGRYAGWSSLVGHGGAVGVEIFFVLSGFLIGGILLRTGEAIATREGLVGFYIRRWFRTLPLFALALAVNVLFEQYVHAHPLTAGEVAGHGFFLRNFSHISLTFFPESWSLATEEWFYLLFPAALFAIVLTSRVRFARAFVIAATVFFLFSTGARIWGAVQPGATWAGTQRCTVIYRFDALMTGVLAAWFSLTCATAWRARARVLKYVGLGLFFGGYAAWWTFHLEGPAEAPDSFFARTFRFTIMSSSVALLLPALSQWKPATEGRVHAVVRQIAIWSYALYLVHWPLFQIVGGDWAQPWQRAAGIWYFIAKVLLAIAIAAILHRVFEAPAMRLRNRWRASRAAATAEPVGASADAR